MNSKKSSKILNNEFLILNIMSYLNPKDLANMSILNSKFYSFSNKFNSYWQTTCQDYFCSTYEEQT